jgi:hypothetical protein
MFGCPGGARAGVAAALAVLLSFTATPRAYGETVLSAGGAGCVDTLSPHTPALVFEHNKKPFPCAVPISSPPRLPDFMARGEGRGCVHLLCDACKSQATRESSPLRSVVARPDSTHRFRPSLPRR